MKKMYGSINENGFDLKVNYDRIVIEEPPYYIKVCNRFITRRINMELNNNKINDENEFEKDLSDLKEWQDNQYNPGFYIGTGRTPRSISMLGKYPVILIILGILFGFLVLLMLLKFDFSIDIMMISLVELIISICLIYGGITRLRKNRRNEDNL